MSTTDRAFVTSADQKRNRTARAFHGAPLFSDTRSGQAVTIEGTGRFVGDPPTGSLTAADEGVESGVTLNLLNVPAPQAAKMILGDILAARYTIAPGIEGKVTIQTPKPVSRRAALDLFQTALRANGAAIVSNQGQYRIVPVDQAAVGATVRVEGLQDPPEEGAGERIGSGLQVVQLKYVAASEIRRVLEPIAPRGGIVRTDESRNLITLSGSGQEIAAMMESIALFDVDVMKGMSFGLVPVKTSQPDVIANELRTIFASDREGPMAGMVQFLPNRRLGSVLVASPQRRYIARAEEWIRRLDAQAQGSEKQLFTYDVQNRRAHELVQVLQSMFAAETGRRKAGSDLTNTRSVAPPYQEASLQSTGSIASSWGRSSTTMSGVGGGASPMSRGAGGPGVTRMQSPVATVTSASPGSTRQDAGATVQLGVDESGEGPRIRVVADEGRNTVLVEAVPEDYRRLMRVISVLDAVPKQVLIEATIAEVSLTDDLKFGVRWQIQSGGNTATFTDAVSGAVNSVFPGFSYAVAAGRVAASLNALAKITDVNIISSPSLTVMDNHPAVLQIGDQVPVTTQTAVSTITIGAPVVSSVSYRDTGVILGITPKISESGRVLLDVEQEVSSVVSTTSSNIDSPTIRQRRIRTSVSVNDGEALVLGGLIQENRNVARTQIPLLGDIPLFGNAFKNKHNEIGKTELIIAITPRVILNSRDARQITEEFRREMAVHTPRRFRQQRSLENTARRLLD